MNVYKGSCHCGRVSFEVQKTEPIEYLLECNCSVCSKKGLVHTPAEDDELVVLTGADDLTLYQFGTNTAKYWFCPGCGVEPFHRSRGNPHRYSVNARCLDDYFDIIKRTGIYFVEARIHPMDFGSDEFKSRENPYWAPSDKLPAVVSDDSPSRIEHRD